MNSIKAQALIAAMFAASVSSAPLTDYGYPGSSDGGQCLAFQGAYSSSVNCAAGVKEASTVNGPIYVSGSSVPGGQTATATESYAFAEVWTEGFNFEADLTEDISFTYTESYATSKSNTVASGSSYDCPYVDGQDWTCSIQVIPTYGVLTGFLGYCLSGDTSNAPQCVDETQTWSTTRPKVDVNNNAVVEFQGCIIPSDGSTNLPAAAPAGSFVCIGPAGYAQTGAKGLASK